MFRINPGLYPGYLGYILVYIQVMLGDILDRFISRSCLGDILDGFISRLCLGDILNGFISRLCFGDILDGFISRLCLGDILDGSEGWSKLCDGNWRENC